MENAPRKILIVDDDRAILALLASRLRHDHSLAEARSGKEALAIASHFHPDLVLLDVTMPEIDGYEVCRRLKARRSGRIPLVIMVSARSSRDDLLRAYEVGGDDYVVKPIDIHELQSRIQLHFRLRDAQARAESLWEELASCNADLRTLATQGTQDVLEVQDVAVFALARLAGCLDYHSGQHVVRIRAYTQLLAERLGYEGPYTHSIDSHFLEDLYRSSRLHDIGKVGIPDSILLKPGRLTTEEYEEMKRHTIVGADILDEAARYSPCASVLSMAAVIARSHHEWWNGSGYPTGLAGQEIPLAARIVAVADVYEALTSKRPYREAFTPRAAKKMVEEGAGSQFDPVIIDAFGRRWNDFLEVRAKHGAKQQLVTCALSFPESEPVRRSQLPTFEYS